MPETKLMKLFEEKLILKACNNITFDAPGVDCTGYNEIFLVKMAGTADVGFCGLMAGLGSDRRPLSFFRYEECTDYFSVVLSCLYFCPQVEVCESIRVRFFGPVGERVAGQSVRPVGRSLEEVMSVVLRGGVPVVEGPTNRIVDANGASMSDDGQISVVGGQVPVVGGHGGLGSPEVITVGDEDVPMAQGGPAALECGGGPGPVVGVVGTPGGGHSGDYGVPEPRSTPDRVLPRVVAGANGLEYTEGVETFRDYLTFRELLAHFGSKERLKVHLREDILLVVHILSRTRPQGVPASEHHFRFGSSGNYRLLYCIAKNADVPGFVVPKVYRVAKGRGRAATDSNNNY